MPTLPARTLALSLVLACGAASAGGPLKPARAKHHPDWAKHASTRYAAMAPSACLAELRRRGVAFSTVTQAPGVRAPVRLPGDVDGVTYRTEAPQHARALGPHDIFDCRLVLALFDWSRMLRAHDIDEVRLFSAFRPRRGSDEMEGTRHAGGLAVDVARFGKRLAPGARARVWLDVAKDFHGQVGAAPCGTAAVAPSPSTPEAQELRTIACATVDRHLFTSILTPNYNRAHASHLHLELLPGVRWYLVL